MRGRRRERPVGIGELHFTSMRARCKSACNFLKHVKPATAFAAAVLRHDSEIATPLMRGSAHTARVWSMKKSDGQDLMQGKRHV